MKIKMFYQSLISDWNHGNAHFLRGVVKELTKLGHDVEVFEPDDNWCLEQLLKDNREASIVHFHNYYPDLITTFYSVEDFSPAELIGDADLVIVHEFNDPRVVNKIGEYRQANSAFKLFFHDTHHRCISNPEEMERYDLQPYDGVLAFGEAVQEVYFRKGWAKRVWIWHEAADVNLFRPLPAARVKDLIWIGNWGDEERSEELVEFLINPVKELGLSATVYGTRYPKEALKLLADAGISYGGYLPNYKVPELFAQHRLTVHIPRRYYAQSLPGIPTIRPFEAMACGIPLISSPWEDRERLFEPGLDFLFAKDGNEMKRLMKLVLSDPELANRMSTRAVNTIIHRHTCYHRVLELMHIYYSLEELTIDNTIVNHAT